MLCFVSSDASPAMSVHQCLFVMLSGFVQLVSKAWSDDLTCSTFQTLQQSDLTICQLSVPSLVISVAGQACELSCLAHKHQ